MKLLLLNTYENQGGAAIATKRLHIGLRSIGVDSQLMVQTINSDDSSVLGPRTKWEMLIAFVRPYLDQVATKLYPGRKRAAFTVAWLPERIASKVAAVNPSIVHLFWVSSGFLDIKSLAQFDRPIVWTLHDMWPFTGGCHYDDGCGRFQDACGRCPFLDSARERDLSRIVWERKHKSWRGLPIVVVATSQWIAKMARSSALFKDKRIEVIPNGLDMNRYKPVNKKVARDTYNLPQDKKLILLSAFGAVSDKRKGGALLMQALAKIALLGWGSRAELVIVGASRPDSPPDAGMKTHYIGYLQDEVSQVVLYSAADVVVAPSIQENLSNTVMESLACGTPVVAFAIGGMPDLIKHHVNGYLATPFEPEDLAQGITWALEDEGRLDALSRHSRQLAVENYSLETIAKRYVDLYQSILT